MTNIKNVSDFRGAGRLTADAINGITDITEELHHSITTIAGLLGSSDEHRTTGITGLIYKNIRAVSGLVGNTIDIALEQLLPLLGKNDPTQGCKAILSALNGVLGDYLADSDNPLTISMQLRWNSLSLDMDNVDMDNLTFNDSSFLQELIKSDAKIVIMVHGLCMNDQEWNRQGHDHGTALARDLGYLPIYLNYNTGLHISENGRTLSDLMEKFINQLQKFIKTHQQMELKISIIAHSMGGLVARSACYYGKIAGHSWLNHLQKIVFLGTPHHGSPLAQWGNWIDALLQINPYSAPFARLGKIRSSGLTDLRCGNLVDEDWKGRDRFAYSGNSRAGDENAGESLVPVPLPDGVECYAIAGTIAKESGTIGDAIIGDGLVPLNSALGRHENIDLNLSFSEKNQWVARDMNHMDLLNHQEVYETIKKWLKG